MNKHIRKHKNETNNKDARQKHDIKNAVSMAPDDYSNKKLQQRLQRIKARKRIMVLSVHLLESCFKA